MKTITIPCHYKYEEQYLPPRCRKFRYREAMAVYPVTIPVVTPDEAPIAFKHSDHIIGVTKETGRYYGSTKVYRFFNGELFTRIPASEKYCGAKGWWKFSEFKDMVSQRQSWSCLRDWDVGVLHDTDACEKLLDSRFSEYLVVESGGQKQVWGRTGEPMYVINTFGLGHNHGGIGTSFGITNYYNSNIGKARYFNALQAKEGKAEALRIAKGRGDTHSFSFIRKAPLIKVLMPELVKRDPQSEHGDGDPFMNKMEDLIDKSSSPMMAGILVMMGTAAEIAS